MNNRQKKGISERVKRRGVSHYSTTEIGGCNLPDDMDMEDHPLREWFKQLSEADNRAQWITDKLDTFAISYQEEITSYKINKIAEEGSVYKTSLTVLPFLDMEFLKDGDKPLTIFAIPTDQISGVVQLIILAEKLKRTGEYVNTMIIFMDSDRLEYGAQHLDAWLANQDWSELVAGIIVLCGFYGHAIAINYRHDSPVSAIWYTLMQEYQLDWAEEDQKLMSSLYLSNSNLGKNYNLVSIGFGLSGSLHYKKMEELSKLNRQLNFADKKVFDVCNEILYRSSIVLNDYYRRT